MADSYSPTIPSRYQIVVQGKYSWNSADERDQLIQRLIANFRLPVETAGELLDRTGVIVMKNLPWERAKAKQEDLERLGLKARVLPMNGNGSAAVRTPSLPADRYRVPLPGAMETPGFPAERYRILVQGKTAWQTQQAKHILAQKLVMTYKVPPLAALQLLDSDSFLVGAAATLEEAASRARRLQALGLPVTITDLVPPALPLPEAWPWERIIVRGSWIFLATVSLLGICTQIPQVIDVLVVRPERSRAWDYQTRLKRMKALRDARWSGAFRLVRLSITRQLSLSERISLTISNRSRRTAGIRIFVPEEGRSPRVYYTRVAAGKTRPQSWKFHTAGRKKITVVFNNSPRLRKTLPTLVTLPLAMNPIPLPKGMKLSDDPRDWKIIVNIYWNPPHQWQYSSIWYRDRELQRFLISSGAWPKPTPLGDYTVANHMWVAVSTIYHTPMPFWNGLSSPIWGTGSFGLHALPGTGYMYVLGSPASHGCIRHSHTAAKWIFDYIPIGTPVTIQSKPEYVEPLSSPRPRRHR